MKIRVVIAALALLLVALQYSIWLGDFGYVRLEKIDQAVVEQERQNLSLEQRNQRLRAEVIDLKQGTAALEERARSQLGMIKEGEVFYQILDPEPQ